MVKWQMCLSFSCTFIVFFYFDYYLIRCTYLETECAELDDDKESTDQSNY